MERNKKNRIIKAAFGTMIALRKITSGTLADDAI